MKISKKLMPLLMLLPLVTGCSMYSADEVEKSEIVGTYKLTNITKKHNQNENPYDYKSEIGAEAYFTVALDGTSYYAYKNNSAPWKVTQAFAIFHRDIVETELYDSISITDGFSFVKTSESEVGCMNEPQMGYKVREVRQGLFGRTKVETLAYTIPYKNTDSGIIHIHQEYQYVCYEKVSQEASLAKLNELINGSYTFNRPFDMQQCRGIYSYTAQKQVEGVQEQVFGNDEYEYMLIDMESYSNGRAILYYSEVANPGQKIGTADISFIQVDDGLNTVKLNVLGKEYLSFRTVGIAGSLTFTDGVIYNEADKYVSQQFYQIAEPGKTIEEVLNTIGYNK